MSLSIDVFRDKDWEAWRRLEHGDALNVINEMSPHDDDLAARLKKGVQSVWQDLPKEPRWAREQLQWRVKLIETAREKYPKVYQKVKRELEQKETKYDAQFAKLFKLAKANNRRGFFKALPNATEGDYQRVRYYAIPEEARLECYAKLEQTVWGRHPIEHQLELDALYSAITGTEEEFERNLRDANYSVPKTPSVEQAMEWLKDVKLPGGG